MLAFHYFLYLHLERDDFPDCGIVDIPFNSVNRQTSVPDRCHIIILQKDHLVGVLNHSTIMQNIYNQWYVSINVKSNMSVHGARSLLFRTILFLKFQNVNQVVNKIEPFSHLQNSVIYQNKVMILTIFIVRYNLHKMAIVIQLDTGVNKICQVDKDKVEGIEI